MELLPRFSLWGSPFLLFRSWAGRGFFSTFLLLYTITPLLSTLFGFCLQPWESVCPFVSEKHVWGLQHEANKNRTVYYSEATWTSQHLIVLLDLHSLLLWQLSSETLFVHYHDKHVWDCLGCQSNTFAETCPTNSSYSASMNQGVVWVSLAINEDAVDVPGMFPLHPLSNLHRPVLHGKLFSGDIPPQLFFPHPNL